MEVEGGVLCGEKSDICMVIVHVKKGVWML